MRYSREAIVPRLTMMVISLLMISCINEDDSNCVQYVVTTSLVDKSGTVLPDSTVGNVKAYLFLNNKFDHVVTAESDGRYLISFSSNAKANLVTFGNMNVDSVNVYTPNVGDDIGTVSVRLLSNRSSTSDSSSPTNLFYGKFDYTSAATGGMTTALLPMYNQHARVHVVVKHLLSKYGTGNYQIVLQGFRNAMAFDGTIAGDSVTYKPNAAFGTDGNFTSETVNTLPTKKDESVMVSMYKDGQLLWQTSTDSTGNSITVAAEDDKCIVIDVQRVDIWLKVMPWSEYLQTTIMY